MKRGDHARAQTLLEGSLAIQRELGDRQGIAANLGKLGNIAVERGEFAKAHLLFEESMGLRSELGNRASIAEMLDAIAVLHMRENSAMRAVQLWSAAQRLRAETDCVLTTGEREAREREISAARRAVSEADFEISWEEGRAMTLEQAIEFALSERPR
jgi:uncharacterized protein HemY